ncbi:hypothetical protein CEK71_09170 [Methylovulum psychrotolerans]|uniref:DUF4276 domain-containing protein n=1 Tax=Methylovulum psychrotolerans TaxID=1704499 RepID=A0A1Z4BY59_9GAMM|nr:hypothetical protein CEK71_09170 [Methylovulum psychrotolerans]
MVSNNLLIVESQNDKFFIERFKHEINAADFDIDTPICNIADYECLDGLSTARLEDKLKTLKRDIGKRGWDKIGILLDADNKGIAARVELVNNAIKCIDPELDISAANTWYHSPSLAVHISCHILNINGSGELETLLKAIKSQPSPYADCLDLWRQCLIANNNAISNKDFDKFWVNMYQRYDCCTKKERQQAGTKCNSEASFQKDIWDFTHASLDGLKDYLMLFN